MSATLDEEMLGDMDAILDEERTDIGIALCGYGPGSGFQDALEEFAASMNEADEGEDSISRKIAFAARRLEELELKVSHGPENKVTSTADPLHKD